MRVARSAWVSIAALFVGSCQPSAALYAAQAADSMDSVGQESAFLVAASDQMTSEMTPEGAATTAAANAGTFFRPAGCYTATASGARVTYVLNDCTGPFGYVHVTGTVVVTYRVGIAGIAFDAETTELEINQATISFTTSGSVAIIGDERQVTASTEATVVGRRGHVMTRSGSYTMSWNPVTECFGLDGSWTASVDDASWTAAVTQYEHCVGGCPMGELSWNTSGTRLTIVFDGSNEAAWMTEGRREREGTVRLFCRE